MKTFLFFFFFFFSFPTIPGSHLSSFGVRFSLHSIGSAGDLLLLLLLLLVFYLDKSSSGGMCVSVCVCEREREPPFFFLNIRFPFFHDYDEVGQDRTGKETRSFVMTKPFFYNTLSSSLSSTVSFQPNKAAGTIISNQSISPSNPCILLSLLSRVRIPILPS